MPATPLPVGTKFGNLKIVSIAAPYVYVSSQGIRHVYPRYSCKCDVCGAERAYRKSFLLRRKSTECNCHQTGLFKHGHASYRRHTSTYRSWQAMISRCTDPNEPAFPNYGGRGITVCEKWIKFEGFLEDMGTKPDRFTIERIENNKGYFKENCRWASRADQNRNKRNNLIFTVRGKTAPLRSLCIHFGVPYPRVSFRVRKGWKIEDALFCPQLGQEGYKSEHDKNHRQPITVRGISGSLKFLCAHFGVQHYITVKRRVRLGWEPEAAMFTAPDPKKVRNQTRD